MFFKSFLEMDDDVSNKFGKGFSWSELYILSISSSFNLTSSCWLSDFENSFDASSNARLRAKALSFSLAFRNSFSVINGLILIASTLMLGQS